MTKIANNDILNKLKDRYNNCRLSVDDYGQTNDGGYICNCYVKGAPHEMEPTYLLKRVKADELEAFAADSKGMVWVRTSSYGIETAPIPYSLWLANADFDTIANCLAEIINTKECKNLYWDTTAQDLYDAYQLNVSLTKKIAA